MTEVRLTIKWTICLSVFIIIILAGVIAGAVKGSQVVKERVVEHISSVPAMPATSSPSVGAGSSTALNKPTGSATPSPDPSPA